MRYELFFAARHAVPSLPQLHAYFAGRPHYQVASDRASYFHPSTGVGFAFSFHPVEGEYLVIFSVEYLRSHVFVLEARPEVAAFIAHFDLAVYDPQDGGMTEGAFEAEAMLRGYNHGNALAHRWHFREHDPAVRPSLPCDERRAIWRWNVARDRYADHLGRVEGSPCAVPRIEFVRDPDAPARARTAVRWLQALPLALPRVDLVLYVPEPGATPSVVAMRDLLPHLADLSLREPGSTFRAGTEDVVVPLPHHLVQHAIAPLELVRTLAGGARHDDLDLLAPDTVLDEEVVIAAHRDPPQSAAG